MALAIYSAAVSLVYALVAIAAPPVAAPLVVPFVALLVVPACWKRVNSTQRPRRP